MCIRRHALHIAVVLSKAALSGPSVCLCEREPPAHFAYLDPERIASEALQAFRLPIGTGRIAPSVQRSCRLRRSGVPWLRQEEADFGLLC